MVKIKSLIKENKFTIAAAFVGFIIFSWIITFHIGTDIQVHTFMVMKNVLPVHFVYYLLIDLFSGFTKNVYLLGVASIFFLTIAIGAKYLISEKLIFTEIFKSETGKKGNENLNKLLILSILFVHPVIYYFDFSLPFMHGKIPVNSWHNSTSIFVMPFVLLVFLHSYNYIKFAKTKDLIFLFLYSVICIFTKPNIIAVLLPVFSLFLLFKYKFTSQFFKGVISISGILLFIGVFFYFSYYTSNSLDEIQYKGQKSGIEFAPFKHFLAYSKNIPADLITSSLFPILFSILYFKSIKDKLIINYAWSFYFVAALIGILFIETGPRWAHSNLIWQMIMCNYILFAVTIGLFLKQIIEKDLKFNYKDYFLSGIYILHLLSGFAYLFKLLILNDKG